MPMRIEVPRARPVAARSERSVLELLKTGTMGSTYDSNDAFEIAHRREVETRLDTIGRGSNREKTAYAALLFRPHDGPESLERGGLDFYGLVSLELRPDVAARSTFTPVDSYSSPARTFAIEQLPYVVAANAIHRDPALRTPSNAANDAREGAAHIRASLTGPALSRPLTMIEAQIRGGIRLSDVASITIRDTADPTRAREIQRLATAAGIPVDVIP